MTRGNTYIPSVSAFVRSSLHASIYPSTHSPFLPPFPSPIDSSTYSVIISSSLLVSRSFIHVFTRHSTYIPCFIYPFIHLFFVYSLTNISVNLLLHLSIYSVLYALIHPRKKRKHCARCDYRQLKVAPIYITFGCPLNIRIPCWILSWSIAVPYLLRVVLILNFMWDNVCSVSFRITDWSFSWGFNRLTVVGIYCLSFINSWTEHICKPESPG